MTKIGEDRSERLDVVPAQFRVIEIVRPRYACNRCKGGGVVQAPAPGSLIEGGLPTEGLLAQVLISKYGDHCPLYRLSQIYARSGVEVHRGTLASWVGQAAFHLRPVVACLEGELKKSGKLGLDETPVRVLGPGRGKTRTGYMWALVRDDRPWGGPDPPGVRLSLCARPGRQAWRRALAGLLGHGADRRLLGPQHSGAAGAGRGRAHPGALSRPRSAQAEGGVRLERLADRVGGSAEDRSALRDREEDPG